MEYSIIIMVDAEDIIEADDIACAMSEDVEGVILDVFQTSVGETKEIKGEHKDLSKA